jgi:hypothetical protein
VTLIVLFIHSFIYVLLANTVGSSGCIVSHDRIINESQIGKDEEGDDPGLTGGTILELYKWN